MKLIALIAATAWLWINFCRFPASPWNDLRLAPVFMAAAGEPVYTLPGAGILTTWMYGPAPLWAWWPATFARDVLSALLVADALNLAITVLAIAATCRWWPATAGGGVRTTAFALCIATMPDHAFRFLQADNPAIALGLIANLLLVREALSRKSVDRSQPASASGRPTLAVLLPAAATAAALGCKQTSIGLLAAQLAWLAWASGLRRAALHLGATLATGGVLAALAGGQLGFREMWFGVVEVPGALPSTDEPLARLREMAPHLALHLGIPAALLVFLGRSLRSPTHHLSLPVLTWLVNLPLGLLALFSAGGTLNSVQSIGYLAPALCLEIVCRVARVAPNAPGRASHAEETSPASATPLPAAWGQAAPPIFIILCIFLRIQLADAAPIRPALEEPRHAAALARAHPGEIWLPWNPLASFFADGRFYHAEDGMYVRFITGHPVSLNHANAGLPPHFRALALPSPRLHWDIAKKLMPAEGVTEKREGAWVIWRW